MTTTDDDEGYKLVPVDPTKAMSDAGLAAFHDPANQHGAILDEVYKAYVKAANKEKVQGWTGRECTVCHGTGRTDENYRCDVCAGTGAEYGDLPGLG